MNVTQLYDLLPYLFLLSFYFYFFVIVCLFFLGSEFVCINENVCLRIQFWAKENVGSWELLCYTIWLVVYVCICQFPRSDYVH